MGAFTPEERKTFVSNWRKTLSERQLLAVAWPPEYGGAGLSQMERTVLAEELAAVGVPNGTDNDILPIGMIGHTIIEWGTEEQKDHFLLEYSMAGTFGVRGGQRTQLRLRFSFVSDSSRT